MSRADVPRAPDDPSAGPRNAPSPTGTVYTARSRQRTTRLFVVAMVIDAVGSGVFLPFTVYYFVSAHDISIGLVGTTIAVANGVLIPFSGRVGAFTDRFGPRNVLIAGNVLRGAVFALYVVADRPLLAMVLLALSTIIDKSCWVSQAALISRLSAGRQARTMFSTVGWARNVGIGVGSAAGGLVASAWSVAGLNALVLINAASYLVAAYILVRYVVTGRRTPAAPGRTARGGLRAMIGDRPFRTLVGVKLCFVVCATAVANFLPYYLITAAHLPPWISGLVLTLNCGLIIVGQQHLTKFSAGVARNVLLLLGGVAYAAGGALFLVTAHAGFAVAIACAVGGMVIYTVGEMVIAPSSDSLAADLAPAGAAGRYMAVYQVGWSVAAVVVPAAGALLLGSLSSWYWAAFLATAAAGALASLRLPEPDVSAPEPVAVAMVIRHRHRIGQRTRSRA